VIIPKLLRPAASLCAVCLAFGSVPARQSTPTCPRGAQGARRAVQTSAAFRFALDATRRQLYPSEQLAAVYRVHCDQLDSVEVVQVGRTALTIVQLPLPREPELFHVLFAVGARAGRVVLLNRVTDDTLVAGLDATAWNAAVRRVAIRSPRADSAAMYHYGCVLLGLAGPELNERNPCKGRDMDHVVSLISAEGARVSLAGKTVEVRPDWTIRRLTLP